MNKQNKILVLFAHPVYHKSRINQQLLQSVSDLEGVTINNLYDRYPDFYIDVQREQHLLLSHDIIIWHHPFYWYSAPAIIKEWIDLVLEHDFAYGKKGTALKGKYIFNAITSGGSRDTYSKEGNNHFTIRQLLAPFEQTAWLCKMTYLPPFVIHGTHLLKNEVICDCAASYRQILISLRDGIFADNDFKDLEYLNDILELNENH